MEHLVLAYFKIFHGLLKIFCILESTTNFKLEMVQLIFYTIVYDGAIDIPRSAAI